MMILFVFLGTALCVGTLLFLERNEKELRLIQDKKELLVITGALIVVEAVLFSFTGYGREFVCHSLVFFYLITAAYIDQKTQQVYRMGSLIFIAFCVLLFLCQKMSLAVRFEKMFSLLIFHMFIVLFGKKEYMGWGDTLTFSGISFWLGAFTKRILTLESCMYCMLFSGIVFVGTNLKNMNWNRLVLRGHHAFLPSIAGGALLTICIVS